MGSQVPLGRRCRWPLLATVRPEANEIHLKETLGSTELLELHSRSFPSPIGRIESLCPPLRFRMLLHGDSANELTFVIVRGNLPDGL